MAKTIHNNEVPNKLEPLPCGGTPVFDYDSGCAYRCDLCFSVIGSIGMPRQCKELLDRATEGVI